MNPQARVVALGASAGGIAALSAVFSRLSPETKATFFVVQHISAHSPNYLPKIFNQHSALPVEAATHDTAYLPGHIYLAPPDHHLTVTGTRMSLNRGPRENRSRPSIDVLFRSVAAAHGPKTIGVVMSGLLDDGTAGLAAIKEAAGVALIQDPADALFPQMPDHARQHVTVDQMAPHHEISSLIEQYLQQPVPDEGRPTSEQVLESQMEHRAKSGIPLVNAIAEAPPGLSCPECGGPLWQLNDVHVPRFRCHTGHAYGSLSLSAAMNDATEQALYAGLRTLEEKSRLLERLAEKHDQAHRLVNSFSHRARECREHAAAIEAILKQIQPKEV